MYIIFDFNGTMFKDSMYHNEVWKMLSKEVRGYSFSDEELDTYAHGNTNKKIIEHLLSCDEKVNYELSMRKESMYRNMVREAKDAHLVEGLETYLDFLKAKGAFFTIASASIKENIDFFYTFFNLSRWFSKEDIFYDDGHYENKVMMFQDAAKHMGVSVQDCYVFEDSFSGINFAKQAGAKGVISLGAVGNEQVMMYIEDYSDDRIYKLVEEE